ncbi:MAG: hypothetical protein HYX62_09470 [Gammaproteobacteria bacterium]|nr:hypothetical protein [Gammaproteobacteria bacterium]
MSQNDATVFQSSIIASLVSPATAAGNCFSGSFATDTTTSATAFTGPALFTTVSKGYNIDNGSMCKLTLPSDLPNADPLLGALTDAGGAAMSPGGGPISLPGGITLPRWVQLPAAGPAVDAIPTDACPTPGVDQRLNARPNVAV